jgi:hypothetical protein
MDLALGCLTAETAEKTPEKEPSSFPSSSAVSAFSAVRLAAMARAADALHGRKGAQLQEVIPLVEALLRDGFHPILVILTS